VKTGSIPVPASNNFNRLRGFRIGSVRAVYHAVYPFPFCACSVPGLRIGHRQASEQIADGTSGPGAGGDSGAAHRRVVGIVAPLVLISIQK
jgi:hypothetical protein